MKYESGKKKKRGRPKMINQAQLGDEFSKESEQKNQLRGLRFSPLRKTMKSNFKKKSRLFHFDFK